ncbi:MAG: GH3 auxin-responsive promoter family protein [Alphaproteobacteria bacterium]|nr:GH3 auxin-responsive promoter family protein [Alphaproteobacteria bacterium]
MASLADTMSSWALGGAFACTRFGPWRQFLMAAESPGPAQEETLRRILRANATTEFGRAHGFSEIKGQDDYRRAVPVQTFDTLRPYATAQDTTGAPSLTAAPPVFYQRTSGTLGTPKDVPLTQAGIDRIRRHQRLAAYAQHAGARLFAGKVVGIGSPAVEGHTAGGTPYGSASGLIYGSQPAIVRAKFVLPPAVFEIADYDARYYTIAALGLAEPRVTGLATANPSTLVKLLEVINQNAERLLRDVTQGRLVVDDALSSRQRQVVDAALQPAPQRARDLAAILDRNGRLTYGDLWPNLAGVVTWMGGSCAVPLAVLRPQLPATAKIIEAGYMSSEFRGTINVDVNRNVGLPTLLDHYFEFVQRDDWERGDDNFQTLDQLEAGEFYYPIVTTADGLYRYNINDIVCVTGKVGATPALAFVQKGKGVTSITGEKVTEAQLLEAVQRGAGEFGLLTGFFVAVADEERAVYVLYLEATGDKPPPGDKFSRAIDANLRALNSEYSAKQASGRLNPIQVRRLRPGCGDAYRRHCVASGQREAQFKVRHLQYAHEVSFAFADYVVEDRVVEGGAAEGGRA